MMNWPTVSLGEYVDLVAGFPFKSERFLSEPAGGVPLVKGENVSQGRILWSISRYWPESEYADYAKFQLRAGDVVLAMDRPWVPAGLKWAFIRDNNSKALLVQRCARLRSCTPKLHQEFLRYLIGGRPFEDYIRPITTGVNVPHISGAQILAFKFALPPAPMQRRIANILSAYDDLIENCERRIRILDEMARALYRKWFVLFRYPGHEKTPLVNSPLGRIPKGWATGAFTDFADVLSGGTPKTDVAEFWNGELPFFTPRDAPSCFYVRDTEKNLSQLGLSKCASELYPPDTVFITARGTVGKVALPSVPMAMNQSCYALRARDRTSQRFLFLLTLHQVDYLKKNTGGATFATIVVDTFRRMQIVLPPVALIAEFTRIVDPMFDAIRSLDNRISNLRRTRDLLLPRLLSGQLFIEDAA